MSSPQHQERKSSKRKGTVDWCEEEIRRLITCVLDTKTALKMKPDATEEDNEEAKLKKGISWESFAADVSKIKGVQRSAKACRTKFRMLQDQYKREILISKENNTVSRWPFFILMSLIHPIVSISTKTSVNVNSLIGNSGNINSLSNSLPSPPDSFSNQQQVYMDGDGPLQHTVYEHASLPLDYKASPVASPDINSNHAGDDMVNAHLPDISSSFQSPIYLAADVTIPSSFTGEAGRDKLFRSRSARGSFFSQPLCAETWHQNSSSSHLPSSTQPPPYRSRTRSYMSTAPVPGCSCSSSYSYRGNMAYREKRRHHQTVSQPSFDFSCAPLEEKLEMCFESSCDDLSLLSEQLEDLAAESNAFFAVFNRRIDALKSALREMIQKQTDMQAFIDVSLMKLPNPTGVGKKKDE